MKDRNAHVRKTIYPYYFTWIAVALYGIFYVLPLFLGFIFSFTNWSIDNLKFNGLFLDLSRVQFVGMKNFLAIFKERRFLTALQNTFMFTAVTVVIKNILSFALALALQRPMRLQGFYRTLFFLPIILSYVVVGVLFTSILRMDGLLNQLLNLLPGLVVKQQWLGDRNMVLWSICAVEIWMCVGFCMTVYVAGLNSISYDYYEAATIDGASYLSKLKNITLPLIAPAITINITMCVIGGFKVFDLVFVMTDGGPGYASQVLNTSIYQTFSEGWLGKSSAMGIVLFVFVSAASLLLTLLMKRKEQRME